MTNASNTMTILVAHGSRDQAWADTFIGMTHNARNNAANTTLAFMELNQPSIQDEINKGYNDGFTTFRILPLFLAKGKHLKKDIPDILAEMEAKLDISTILLDPIGEHPELSDAIEGILRKLQNPA